MYRFKIMVFLGLVFLLIGCGSDSSDSTPEPTPEPTSTESALEATSTPQPTEPVSAGEQIFRTRCASCHYLSDMEQVGPGLAGLFSRETLPDGEEFSEEALADFITQGGGAMQAINLSMDEIDELISYLREATIQ